jgi:outer membrane protein assembly factor BamB
MVVGDREGIFYCLALRDGKQLWQFKAGKGIFSTPAITGNKVVFGSVDNMIYCLSLDNGKQVWKFKADSYVLGSPVIADGKVYIGASDGRFRAIDVATGKLIWEFSELKAWVDTKPVLYKGKVFFGAWDNYFYAPDQQTGKLAWKWIRSKKESYPSAYYAPGACWPVAANDRIFLTGPDMILTALNAQTGDSLWRTGTPRLNEAIGISGDGSKVFVKCTFDSTLIAYSTTADKPEIIWKTQDHYGFDDNQAAIIEKNGTAYFTFRNGWIIAVNANNGQLLWKHNVGNIMLNAATPVSEKEVIITDADGTVMLLKANAST